MISLKQLRTHLYSYDLSDLTSFPVYAPEDEYNGKAACIYGRLKEIENPSLEDAEKIIKEVFESAFSEPLNNIDVSYLAKTILFGDIHICPVCRKYYFKEEGHYEVCEVCGWEDDSIQYEDHFYTGGANPLSVNICQMKFFLLHEDSTSSETKKLTEEYKENFGKIYGDVFSADPPNWDGFSEKIAALNYNYAKELAKLFLFNFATFRNPDEKSKEKEVDSFLNQLFKRTLS
ncbi:MAG: hypothetical protein K6C13_00555 [Oscillospiraceae bacterium]|nr:hypothetical protein [Oscillospiraceae bacterium]